MTFAPHSAYSCPWCLARPGQFHETVHGETACGRCSAVIPVGVQWYMAGEKIVTVREAVQQYSVE